MRRKKCVVVGAVGSIGSLLLRLLAPSFEVFGVDRSLQEQRRTSEGATLLPGDITRPDAATLEVLAQSDLVVLAISLDLCKLCWMELDRILKPRCLVVDTLSIKAPYVAACIDSVPSRPVLGLNPMFSGDLEVRGRPMAVVVYRDSPEAQEFIGGMVPWGIIPVSVTAQQHDQMMAQLQVLTHAVVLLFARTLAGQGADLQVLHQLAPPPFQLLLSLAARIVKNSPHVYWEIQVDNPYAAAMRLQLEEGLQALQTIFSSQAESEFAQAFTDIQKALGPQLNIYGKKCQKIFAQLQADVNAEAGE